MRPLLRLLPLSLLACLLGQADKARASDVDLGGSLLLGTGVDTGKAPNNPYQLQLGGAGELTIDGIVLGVRGTRSLGSDETCAQTPCRNVKDLRTIGGDLGFAWDLLFLRISPRFGAGRLKERDGSIVAPYLEPGGVAELQLMMLTLGAEVRYRFALGDPDVNGLLAYLRLGLRM